MRVDWRRRFYAFPNAGLVVGNPMADFELQHRALPTRRIKLERTIQSIGSLLVVIEHEVAPDGGYLGRESQPQAPAGNVDLVGALVAQIPVPICPEAVEVVVKMIARKR